VSINFDAALLKKLSKMTLRARYVAEGFMAGLHQSPFRGASLEFAQHRQYSPGDEMKHLDWKVYGKTDRFYIKQYQEERNLRGYSIIDTSDSMGFTTGRVTKLEYSSYLSAALTYLMIKQRDSAGLITFASDVQKFLPARNNKGHMHFIMEELDSVFSKGQTDFVKSVSSIGKAIKKRSLLMLFSDLLDDPDKIIKCLKFFPYMKNDLIVFHVLDPGEIQLKEEGPVEYIDSETGVKLRTQPEVIKKEYSRRFNRYLLVLEKGLRSHNIDYYRITTDTGLDKAVSMFMEGRKKILS